MSQVSLVLRTCLTTYMYHLAGLLNERVTVSSFEKSVCLGSGFFVSGLVSGLELMF
jgi:hypothetical protein